MRSSKTVLRRWRAWTLSKLLPHFWPSSRGEHLHRNCAGVEGAHTAISSTCEEVQLAVTIVCGISCRGDFIVQLDSRNPTSVFQLLQEACLHMGRLSHSIMQGKTTAAKPSHHHLHQRFVYSRFMWGECEYMSQCVKYVQCSTFPKIKIP